MSLLRSLDRTSAVSHQRSVRPLLTFLWPVLPSKTPERAFTKSAINNPSSSTSDRGPYAEQYFISALARAASCPEHAKQISTPWHGHPLITPHHKKRSRRTGFNTRREYATARPITKGPFRIVKTFAEKELKALVDYYEFDTLPPAVPDDVVDEGSLVWNVGDEHEKWPPKEPKDAALVEKLEALTKLDKPSHDEIWETYRQISEPRVVYLPGQTIHDILHQLSILERPGLVAMQRYLSILDDMKDAHIHIRRHEWTTAAYLAGRYRSTVSADDLQSALYLWRDMEQRANVKASHVTFNVLFDIAVKAGKFTLAEVFLREMRTRKLKFHRHFRVSLLYYHGVMQNGSGVRRVYQDMIEAGDIVDVVVMNAVIAALFRAGEPSAAEHVFERMKRLAATGHVTSSTYLDSSGLALSKSDRTWRGQRKLGLRLTYAGRHLALNNDPEAAKRLQDWAPIAPNSRTYSLLIRHQATMTGNIDRINELLREMGYNGVPLEGSIFVVIFRGFAHFGGVRYSFWTRAKLEQTWTEYLQAVSDGLDRTWISRTSVIAVLKAFNKCADQERMMQVWDEIKEVWLPSEEEEENVLEFLKNLTRPDRLSISRKGNV